MSWCYVETTSLSAVCSFKIKHPIQIQSFLIWCFISFWLQSLIFFSIQKTAPASTSPTPAHLSLLILRSTWRWTAGPSARTRTRCWTWPSLWAPSCCLPSPCPWASSWTNTVRGSCDFWAGKAKIEIHFPFEMIRYWTVMVCLFICYHVHTHCFVFPVPALLSPASSLPMVPVIPTVSTPTHFISHASPYQHRMFTQGPHCRTHCSQSGCFYRCAIL